MILITINKDNTKSFKNITKVGSLNKNQLVFSDEDVENLFLHYNRHILKTNYNNIKERIILSCCQEMKVNPMNICKKIRKREYSITRQIIIFILYNIHYGSSKRIGEVLNRDHATVLYSVKTVRNMLEVKDMYIYPHLKKLLILFKLWDNKNDTVIPYKEL